jgi:trigger factor
MDPNEFVKILSENGQIPSMVGEVARNKALAIILGKVKVVDTDGKPVDLAEFTAIADGDDTDAADEAPVADESATEEAAAEEAPAAEEKPKKRSTKKKADDK